MAFLLEFNVTVMAVEISFSTWNEGLCKHISVVVALSDSTSAGWLIPSLSLSYLFTSRY